MITYRPADPDTFPAAARDETVPVRIALSYKWMHASLAMPRDAIERGGGPAADALDRIGEGDWIMIGWGDEDYYRERGITDARLFDFIRSMLEPDSPTVIEFDPEPGPPTPENTGQNVMALQLSRHGAAALVERLDAAFDLEAGTIQAAGRGRDPGSQFFTGYDRSDLTQNCNHWIADLLHAAGVPSIGVLNTASAGLALNLSWLANAQEIPGNPDEHVAGPETPPTHSGTYALVDSTSARAASDLAFDGYTVQVGEAILETEPAGLLVAEEAGLSEMLDVPAHSLVDVRQIVAIDGQMHDMLLCDGDPAERAVIGFETGNGGPYEIAIAFYESASFLDEPCATGRYRQP